MASGIVKWWSRKKGYGFLRVAGFSDDVFVHWQGLVGEGYRNLTEGERVRCRVIDRGKGPLAVDVERVPTWLDGRRWLETAVRDIALGRFMDL